MLPQSLHHRHLAIFPECTEHPRAQCPYNDTTNGRIHCLLGRVLPVPVYPARALQKAFLFLQSWLRSCDDINDDLVPLSRQGSWSRLLPKPESAQHVALEHLMADDGRPEPSNRTEGSWHG